MSQTTCLINEVLCGYKILKITQAISITLKASRHIFKQFCEVIKYLLCYDSMYYREIEVLTYGKVKSSYVIC